MQNVFSLLLLSYTFFNKHSSIYEIFHDHSLVARERNEGVNVLILFCLKKKKKQSCRIDVCLCVCPGEIRSDPLLLYSLVLFWHLLNWLNLFTVISAL